VGDGSMWVLTKGGVLAEGGDLVRLCLGGEPVPGLGPGVGYLEKSLLLISGVLLSSVSKPIRGLVTRGGEPGVFRRTAFDRAGL